MTQLRSWIYGLYRWFIGRPVHCWAGKLDWMEETGQFNGEWTEECDCDSTCFRLYGHIGPHEWIRNDEISISFPREDQPR